MRIVSCPQNAGLRSFIFAMADFVKMYKMPKIVSRTERVCAFPAAKWKKCLLTKDNFML